MANKLIIDNRTDISDMEALRMVIEVVEMGRISNDGKQYCYGTSIAKGSLDIMIWAYLNKKSDRFVIVEDKRK